MKILPPISHWLPALMKSRAGQALGAGLVIIAALAATFALRPATDTRQVANNRPAPTVATYQPAPATCSGLVLDRSHHSVALKDCPPVPIRAGDSIIANRPLTRSPMPPRANRLTPADRAIAVPKSLRTSVWDVGVAQTRPDTAPPAVTAGETAVKP